MYVPDTGRTQKNIQFLVTFFRVGMYRYFYLCRQIYVFWSIGISIGWTKKSSIVKNNTDLTFVSYFGTFFNVNQVNISNTLEEVRNKLKFGTYVSYDTNSVKKNLPPTY